MPIELRQAAFLLERLAADTAPLQEYRELTKNSLEAVARAAEVDAEAPDRGYQVVWDVEWHVFNAQLESGQKPTYKLSIWDNGDGMTGPEMVEYINHLASSVGVQALDRNFGVGAKITAGVSNPEGLIYTSYKNGEVHQIHFWRDPDTNEYGIKPYLRQRDNTFQHWRRLRPDVLPREIIEAGHGTMVTLLGRSGDANTMLPPEGAVGAVRWLVRYLNRRFMRFPDGVTVRVREFAKSDPSEWPNRPTTYAKDGGIMRQAFGQAHYLDMNAEASGSLRVGEDDGNATAYWWLLNEDKVGDPSYWLSSGHVAALFQDELYELRDGNAGIRQLMHFGVLFGSRRVVIYVQPDSDQEMTPNTARSQLLANGEPLPWEDWAADFREHLPAEIKEMMDELLSRDSNGNHEENIRQRLKKIEQLMRFTRYRRSSSGSVNASGDAAGGGAGEGDTDESAKKGKSGSRGGTAADLYGAYVDEDEGDPAEPLTPQSTFPEIKWVSIAKGTRSADDTLEDRAASYVNSTQNVLLINEDFRVYNDLVKHFARLYEGYPGVEQTVPEVVKEWYAQQLVEAVIGVLAVRGSAKWPPNEVDSALSEEALTAVVMPRYNLYQQVSRVLGTKLGSLKDRVEAQAAVA
ncbi:MAG TPA: hypothetical protein VJT75_11740 [Thermoleophilaceae bacterium]|nr:hypothetical protein [Thermoleophilaceae bacterium]